jgi:ferredoxin
MPKIIINQKTCDKSPDCGGIAVCPSNALFFDYEKNQVEWDQDKCIFCLRCTLPDGCSIGAIMYARDEVSEKAIIETIKSDPRSEEWLWQERFGVQPGRQPIAKELDETNFEDVLSSPENNLIDIWHEDYLNCRLHSILYEDISKKVKNLTFYKLDAKKYPKLVDKLGVKLFPTLQIIINGKINLIYKGDIEESKISTIIKLIQNIIN